jgi:hypothetical protein
MKNCVLAGAASFVVTLVIGVFVVLSASEPAFASGDLCYSCSLYGVASCCTGTNGTCPSSVPTCGKVTGGDGCSCK